MSKRNLIEKAEQFLTENGFAREDYIISLQGPTVIFTVGGLEKINRDLTLKADLIHMGMKML
jgi:hypothetical protein